MSTSRSESIGKLATALALVQKELTHSKKNSKAHNGPYSNLSDIITSSRDLLTANGLAITQLVGETVDRVINVTTILMHSSGEYLETTASVPIIKCGSNDAQGMGASISYLRRYSYQSIICQASEDNDADGSNSLRPSKSMSDKQLALLRSNFDKLTEKEIAALKNKSMQSLEASQIIGEVLNGKR